MSFHNPGQTMLSAERQILERDLLQRLEQEFLALKAQTSKEVTEVIKRMVRDEIISIEIGRNVSEAGGESGKGDMGGRGMAERDGTERIGSGQTMAEIAAINAKLDHALSRLSAIEASNVQRDAVFRKELDERFQMIEQMMNAILTGTDQGKQFITENFVLDPIKYQELLNKEATSKEEIRRLSEGWRERAESQKKEDEERRRINRLRRIGREAAQAAREYSEAMAREKEKQEFWARQQRWLQEEQIRAAGGGEQNEMGYSQSKDQTHMQDEAMDEERITEEKMSEAADGKLEVEDGPEKEGADEQTGEEYGAEFEGHNPVVAHWQQYERQGKNNGPLSFSAIRWPTLVDPNRLEKMSQLQAADVLEEFLLSPHHSHGLTAKKRINIALLRWHPDKGSRLLPRIRPVEDRRRAEGIMTLVAASLASIRARLDRG